MPAAVQSGSTDPAAAAGISNADRAMILPANLMTYEAHSLTVQYPAGSYAASAAEAAPAQANLVEVQIDMTDYFKSKVINPDLGFLISMEGTSPSKAVFFLSKEIGDGTLGAKLLLSH